MALRKALIVSWALAVVHSELLSNCKPLPAPVEYPCLKLRSFFTAQKKNIALVTMCDDKYAPLATMMLQSAREIGSWTNEIFIFASRDVAQVT